MIYCFIAMRYRLFIYLKKCITAWTCIIITHTQEVNNGNVEISLILVFRCSPSQNGCHQKNYRFAWNRLVCYAIQIKSIHFNWKFNSFFFFLFKRCLSFHLSHSSLYTINFLPWYSKLLTYFLDGNFVIERKNKNKTNKWDYIWSEAIEECCCPDRLRLIKSKSTSTNTHSNFMM